MLSHRVQRALQHRPQGRLHVRHKAAGAATLVAQRLMLSSAQACGIQQQGILGWSLQFSLQCSLQFSVVIQRDLQRRWESS